MDIYVRNKELQRIGIIDVFESLVWVDRYYGAGWFEIYTEVEPEIFALLQQDYYVEIDDSPHTMIIETIEIITDVEKGNKLRVSGRSLESILHRRVVLAQTQFNSVNWQTIVTNLLTTAFMTNTTTVFGDNRYEPRFQVESNPDFIFPIISIQAFGDDLYDVIDPICNNNRIGWRIFITDDGKFQFKMYRGEDRSYHQTENPYVVFSPSFDNLINSNYLNSKSNLRTAFMLMGDNSDGITPLTFTWVYGADQLSGIDHREAAIDLQNITKFVNGVAIPAADYSQQLREGAMEKRSTDFETITEFEGQADFNVNFKYGTDFFLGDLVQLENEYGFSDWARIIEVTISESASGHSVYPTFNI